MKPSGRGCGTCKDRRISCDRCLPSCFNCVRSNRHCQGYDVRLSWPRADDRKRAMLGTTPMRAEAKGIYPLRIVNTSNSDIEIHYNLTIAGFKSRPVIPTTISWSPVTSDAEHNLLQYFVSHASNSLIAVHPSNDSPTLREIVMRVALSQGTASSTAVLQSLLALSSLHRHGIQSHAAQLKLAALSALAASAKAGVQAHEVISHVSALMLLCSFEIQASDSANQWLLYISGVKNVLRSVHHGPVEKSSDMASLLYWVSYHDILSRFSLRYWKNSRSFTKGTMQTEPEDVDILVKETMNLEASDVKLICPRMLAMISEVLDVAVDGVNNKSSITLLEWKVRKYLVCTTEPQESQPGVMLRERPLCQELFQLALLVYIERASSKSPRQSEIMRTRLDAAFKILSQIDTMERQFPLLIIGCEARTDEDRIIVLDLISRTEESSGYRSLNSLKALIQSLWAQDDLAERELGYSDKIEAVMSSSRILPSFA